MSVCEIATPRATDSGRGQGHDVIHDLPERSGTLSGGVRFASPRHHARLWRSPDQRRSRCRPRFPVLFPARSGPLGSRPRHALALFTMAASGWVQRSWAKERSPPRSVVHARPRAARQACASHRRPTPAVQLLVRSTTTLFELSFSRLISALAADPASFDDVPTPAARLPWRTGG